MLDPLLRIEQIRPADKIAELPDPQARHQLARFLGDEKKVVHHVFGFPGEFLAQYRVLRRHADRAGVQVAFAHHDAAAHHQRRRSETEFVRSEDRPDHHVAAGLDLPVHLHGDAAAQAVQHQRLLGLREPEFPGRPRMLDR